MDQREKNIIIFAAVIAVFALAVYGFLDVFFDKDVSTSPGKDNYPKRTGCIEYCRVGEICECAPWRG